MRYRRKRNYYRYSPYSRRRLNWGKVLLVLSTFIIVIGVIVGLNFRRIQLISKGYSFKEQNIILKLDKDDVKALVQEEKLDHIKDWVQYSEHVDLYDEYERYISIYDENAEIIVNEVDALFIQYKDQLIDSGYDGDHIWKVLKKVRTSEAVYLLKNNYYFNDIKQFIDVRGFNCRSVSQYLKAFKETNSANYAVLITEYPFIISSNKADLTYTITNPDAITNIVKVGFALPENYEPEDLVEPNVPLASDEIYYIRKEASDALEKMFNDASQLGYELILNSSYRSYAEQKKIYDEYFSIYDEVTASGLVAKPGLSEHQTGLGVDLTCRNVLNLKNKGIAAFFGDSDDGKWTADNAHKYGFILRYPTNSSHITGISNEPWHFRYVGVEAATLIYENNWTLEEYCLYEGVLPKFK